MFNIFIDGITWFLSLHVNVKNDIFKQEDLYHFSDSIE